MVKGTAVAQVTYQVPDLDKAESFMTDFGLTTVQRDNEALYMRGGSEQHHIYVAKQGKMKFIGAAIEVRSMEDLQVLAKMPGSSPVQASSEPGGGHEVVMHTPDGFEIKAVYGRKTHDLEQEQANLLNDSSKTRRINASIRTPRQPCEAIRIGHFVLHVSNHEETVKWMRDRFGMLPSDYFGTEDNMDSIYGTMLRFDKGDELVDHHVLLVLQSDWLGVHHAAFEVRDLDALMGAHEYLVAQGWKLDVGPGRHMLGSQIFDYWKDPFGFRMEHYTDGDMVNGGFQPSIFTGTASETTQWGDEPPLEFFQ